MNDDDFRDACAMMAMVGKLINGTPWKPEECFYLADCMLEARKATEEQGIAAAKPKKARKS
jgi:hypothetical protein